MSGFAGFETMGIRYVTNTDNGFVLTTAEINGWIKSAAMAISYCKDPAAVGVIAGSGGRCFTSTLTQLLILGVVTMVVLSAGAIMSGRTAAYGRSRPLPVSFSLENSGFRLDCANVKTEIVPSHHGVSCCVFVFGQRDGTVAPSASSYGGITYIQRPTSQYSSK